MRPVVFSTLDEYRKVIEANVESRYVAGLSNMEEAIRNAASKEEILTIVQSNEIIQAIRKTRNIQRTGSGQEIVDRVKKMQVKASVEKDPNSTLAPVIAGRSKG